MKAPTSDLVHPSDLVALDALLETGSVLATPRKRSAQLTYSKPMQELSSQGGNPQPYDLRALGRNPVVVSSETTRCSIDATTFAVV